MTNTAVDPRWAGIIEVLVRALGGEVRWQPDSVVLGLPGHPCAARVADLDCLGLCLGRVGLPVVFDSSGVGGHDPSLAEFLRKLAESGLMAEAGRRVA
jgi:hypothetical protein